ncbi:MAG: hypothetical protein SGARI_005891 [Bacillariaceae sp.]
MCVFSSFHTDYTAKAAAKVLGYDEKLWDSDEDSAYGEKTFEQLSSDEKRAAMLLGASTLDGEEAKFNGIYWEQISDEIKGHASALGFDQHKWDDGWKVHDLDVEHKYWDDLTEDQQDAAEFFGYTKNIWNEEGCENETFGSANAAGPTEEDAPADFDSDSEDDADEKKEDDAKDDGGKPASKPTLKKKKKRTKKIVVSQLLGGDGTGWDHPASRHIDEISVFASGNTIHGLIVKYQNVKDAKQAGPTHGDETKMKFRPGEFITKVKVNASDHVEGLTFFTNKGTKLGPCGGDGGVETELSAPEGYVLVGMTGRTNKKRMGRTRVSAIAFKWGPNPRVNS